MPEALVAVSCSKNFGLYRERTGALFILAETAKHADTSLSHLFAISRPNYSMPPDHGAAVVSTILTDTALTNIWDEELTEMRERILSVREKIASLLGNADVDGSHFATQYGMFSLLPLSSEQITTLKENHAIYMAGSGRINLAGLADEAIERFVEALKTQMQPV